MAAVELQLTIAMLWVDLNYDSNGAASSASVAADSSVAAGDYAIHMDADALLLAVHYSHHLLDEWYYPDLCFHDPSHFIRDIPHRKLGIKQRTRRSQLCINMEMDIRYW